LITRGLDQFGEERQVKLLGGFGHEGEGE